MMLRRRETTRMTTVLTTLGALLAVLVAASSGCTSKQKRPSGLPDVDDVEAADADESDPWAGRDLLEPPAPPAPAPVPLPDIERFELENGLEVIVVEDPDVPVAEMRLAVRAGEREVPREKTGLARFAAQMLTHGTKRRDALEIAETIDFAGGVLGAEASHEATWVSCEVMSKDLDTCLELLPDVLLRPTFPEDEMAEVERNLQSEIRARRDDAGQLAARHLQNELWGDDHVRGWILSETSLGAISRDDLVQWHRQWFSPDNAVLAVAGDVDAEALGEQLQRAFGRWKPRELPERPEYDEPTIEGMRIRLVDKPDQTQAHIHLGHLGISRHDEDFFDVVVMNYVLGGGGFSSRLMEVLRAEEGKTYGASSRFDRSADRGAFVASTFTRTPEVVATTDLLLGELMKLAAEGPTEAEVEGAVGNLAARYAMRFETAGDVAAALVSARVRGLDTDDVRDYPLGIGRVTAESASAAAARRLDPKNLVAVIVGSAEEIAPQLDRVGWSYDVVGHHEPVAAYERRADRAAADAPVDPEAARKAVEILDRALAAKGGYDRVSSIEAIVYEGSAEMQMGPQGLNATLERVLVRPDKLRVDFDIGGGMAEVTTGYDGERAWIRQVSGGQNQVNELPASERRAVEAELWRDPELILLRHRQEGTIAEARGEETIEGEPHHVVRLRGDDHEAVLYIDKSDHRIRRMTYPGARGGETTETYDDYREVSGIAVAHKRESNAPQQSLKLRIKRVRFNEQVDGSRFTKPSN